MARVDREYVSSIAFMEQRDILKEVLDVTSEDTNILDIMDMAGRSEVTDVVDYHHFENDYLFTSGLISAAVTGGSGVDVACVITVATTDELPVVGENAMNDDSKLIGWVSAVDTGAKTFDLKPKVGTNWTVTGIPASGETMIYFSGSFGEGSEDPEGRQPKWNRSVNNIQIFKESGTITDLQKVSKVEVNYDGKPHVMYKMQHDTLMRHRAKIAYAYLVGEKDKRTDADGNAVYNTQGLRQYILGGDGAVATTGGVEQGYTAGSFAKSDFKVMSRKLDKKGAPDEYWAWFGGDLHAENEDMFHSLDNVKNGGIQYNSFGKGDGKKKALDFGINSVYLYGRSYHFTKLKAYDHEELFGAGNFDFAEEGYLIPTGKIKVDKGGATKERILNRYMSGDGTDLQHVETVTGKLAPNPTSTKSVLSVGYESVCGLEVLGVKHFGMFS